MDGDAPGSSRSSPIPAPGHLPLVPGYRTAAGTSIARGAYGTPAEDHAPSPASFSLGVSAGTRPPVGLGRELPAAAGNGVPQPHRLEEPRRGEETADRDLGDVEAGDT